jgi:hypothetical protein
VEKSISSGKEKAFHLPYRGKKASHRAKKRHFIYRVGIKFTSSGNERALHLPWPFLPEQIVRNPGKPRIEIVFLACLNIDKNKKEDVCQFIRLLCVLGIIDLLLIDNFLQC